jgi:pimeloyl-ACP methyl ester carboxylesterase
LRENGAAAMERGRASPPHFQRRGALEVVMDSMNRRTALRGAVSLGIAASLAGCKDVIDVIGQACPEDPADQGGIDWVPDLMHPVAAAFQDVDVAQGAPGPARLWYPTFEVFTDEGGPPTPRRILKHCLARWPVVLFLHGQEPCTIANYNRAWTNIPASLARSGYVVIAPQHGRLLPQDNSGVPFVAGFIDWVRNTWEHARFTDKRRDAVAVVGHSYGALLGARVATERSDISACAFLSGPFAELNDRNSLLRGLGRPTFYMFSPTENFANVNDGGLWDSFEYPKYAAQFEGEHFDYITQPPGCGKPVGSCSLIKAVAADLVTLFLSRYMGIGASKTFIGLDLVPPDKPLAPGKQQFFGANRLPGLALIQNAQGCSIDLKWKEGSEASSRHLGP